MPGASGALQPGDATTSDLLYAARDIFGQLAVEVGFIFGSKHNQRRRLYLEAVRLLGTEQRVAGLSSSWTEQTFAAPTHKHWWVSAYFGDGK